MAKQRYVDRIIDDEGRQEPDVPVTVRESADGIQDNGLVGEGGDVSGPGAGGGGGDDSGGSAAESGGDGGAWGAAGTSKTGAAGGAGGHAVKLTGGASVTWIAGNTAARVKGAVGP